MMRPLSSVVSCALRKRPPLALVAAGAEKLTGSEATGLPLASWTTTITDVAADGRTVAGVSDIEIWVGGPATKSTNRLSEARPELGWRALTVARPMMVEEYRRETAWPLLLVVADAALSPPALVAKLIVCPAIGAPDESTRVAVSKVAALPSAMI